ncbi:MAG TPA: D-alanine--D-alanine ligase family protein [Polyangiaceae bacterium]|nr:D-alanine--D-alanine ligase family protein [Polyangiaceae bacterium]
MTQKLRVLVLFGGRSAEHEISLLSARFVVEALDPARYEALLVGIDKQGRWQLESRESLLGAGKDASAIALSGGLPQVSLPPRPAPSGALELVVESRAPLQVDVVFPVLHGPMGEDGTMQGLLELSGLPYVGAGVLGSAVGMDKDVMKRLLLQAGLPVLPYVSLRRAAYQRARAEALAAAARLAFPVFVKPANLGSSVGVSRVLEPAGLASAIDSAFEFDGKVVIEQGLEHPREIECAVLGGSSPVVSVPGEIVVDHPDGFYSYAAKYLDASGATMRIPAQLSEGEQAQVRELALRTFDALECDGMARVDLFLSKQRELFVNEINTIPGFTSISMYPKLMEASGVPARELVSRLIDDAIARAAHKRARKTSAHD